MKKFALNNSYFKNRRPWDPDTILEIVKYLKENWELPFRYEWNNFVYDAMCERQKKKSVYNNQFLTPNDTAIEIAYKAKLYTDAWETILDACCWTGQLAKYIINMWFDVEWFDIDEEMVEICKLIYPDKNFWKMNYKEPNNDRMYQTVVANPPYNVNDLIEFLQYIYSILPSDWIAVLLIPMWFLDKSRPRNLVKVMNNFAILERRPMEEEFARTKVRAEIVVLEAIK